MIAIDPTRLCQIEIQVGDLDRALDFYNGAFGWKTVPAEMHEYVVLDVPPGCPFGISLVSSHKGADDGRRIVLYFGVDDPDEVVARVVAHGGRKRFGPAKMSAYGEIYQIEDPDGHRYGLYRQTSDMSTATIL